MNEPKPELKVVLQNFLDCKDETAIIAEKSIKLKSEEAYRHVIGEQEKCLTVIKQLKSYTHPSLAKYTAGLEASNARIGAEKRFLENILEGKNDALTSSSLGIGLVSQKEKEIWTSIRKEAAGSNPQDFNSIPGHMVFGWVFFIFITILLIFKGRIGVNSESVKLYFDSQRAKFLAFLVKILNSDKK